MVVDAKNEILISESNQVLIKDFVRQANQAQLAIDILCKAIINQNGGGEYNKAPDATKLVKRVPKEVEKVGEQGTGEGLKLVPKG